jgi:hypothetical protein
MSTLHDFASKTDKSFAHQYIHVYEALFEPIRNTVTNVLELGIWGGESLRMWRDYFSNAQVYGMDIFDNCNGMALEDRITAVFTDAYTKEAVKHIAIRFDVIVDDGPHTLESQCFAVANYSHLLTDNGILVVEDIPHPEWIPAIAASVPEHLKMYSYAIDRRWVPNRNSINDELMFVIDKRFI